MENLTGKQLGAYRIVEPLGEGGMAAVYKAYQAAMDRYVAVKVLPQQLARDPQFVGRFKQEAQLLAKLQHPHILPIFDFGETDGYTYLVMPFVESGTLTELFKGVPLPPAQIRDIISQVGDALDYAHSRGLVHRDVKPSNVLIDARGNCLLTDFGLAKMVEGNSRFTTTGGILGTPAYMSPEQGRGVKVDARTDIYALGIMLYEMATGRVPFDADTPIAIVFKHIQDPLPLPHTLNPKIPDSIERVILKALAKDPDDRYASAGEMVRALQAAIPASVGTGPSEPIARRQANATLAPTTGTAQAGGGSRRWVLVAGVVGIALCIGVAALLGGGVLLQGLSKRTLTPTVVVVLPATATVEPVTPHVPSVTPAATVAVTVPPTETTTATPADTATQAPTALAVAPSVSISNEPPWKGGYTHINISSNVAQSFKATGSTISAVEVELLLAQKGTKGDILDLRIITTKGEVLSESVETVPGDFEGWQSFKIVNGLTLTPGETYLISLQDSNAGVFLWKNGGDTYADGAAIVNRVTNMDVDYFFRIYP